MSEGIEPIGSVTQSISTTGGLTETEATVKQKLTSTNATDVSNMAQANPQNKNLKNVSEFKEMYPEFYDKFCENIANNIINDMKKHQKRMKDILKDNQ